MKALERAVLDLLAKTPEERLAISVRALAKKLGMKPDAKGRSAVDRAVDALERDELVKVDRAPRFARKPNAIKLTAAGRARLADVARDKAETSHETKGETIRDNGRGGGGASSSPRKKRKRTTTTEVRSDDRDEAQGKGRDKRQRDKALARAIDRLVDFGERVLGLVTGEAWRPSTARTSAVDTSSATTGELNDAWRGLEAVAGATGARAARLEGDDGPAVVVSSPGPSSVASERSTTPSGEPSAPSSPDGGALPSASRNPTAHGASARPAPGTSTARVSPNASAATGPTTPTSVERDVLMEVLGEIEADAPTVGKPLPDRMSVYESARLEAVLSYVGCKDAQGSVRSVSALVTSTLDGNTEIPPQWPRTLKDAASYMRTKSLTVPSWLKATLDEVAPPPPPPPPVIPSDPVQEIEAARARAPSSRSWLTSEIAALREAERVS